MTFRASRLLLLAAALLAQGALAQEAGLTPPELPVVTPILDSGGAAALLVPPGCQRQACPLLVVSHRWQGKPEHGLDSAGHPAYSRFLGRFAAAGYALLLSNDGGPETWGNAAALDHAVRVWERARTLFLHSGETFTLGVSMGGLPATLLGLAGRLPVMGTVLIAPALNLPDLAARNPTFAASIARAHPVPAPTSDPVNGWGDLPGRPAPTLVVASREDQTVDFEANAAAYATQCSSLEPRTRLLEVAGPHLSGGFMSDAVADEALAFLEGLRGSGAS